MKKPLNPEYTDWLLGSDATYNTPVSPQKKDKPVWRCPQNKGKSISRRRPRTVKSASTLCQVKSMGSTKRHRGKLTQTQLDSQSATPVSDHSHNMNQDNNLVDQTLQNHDIPNHNYPGTREDYNQQADGIFGNPFPSVRLSDYGAIDTQWLDDGQRWQHNPSNSEDWWFDCSTNSCLNGNFAVSVLFNNPKF